MILTDLREIKSYLEIDPADLSEDKKLLFFIEHLSSWIEERYNRDFLFKARTQYYNGTGTQKLLLKNRPVYPNPPAPYPAITVIYDENGFFGLGPNAFTGDGTQIQYVLGVDFTLRIDQDDGSSRSGILYRMADYWTKPQVRQAGLLSPFIGPDTGSIQVTYTAGYTVDTLPGFVRGGVNAAVAKMRYLFPLGIELASESYEERAIASLAQMKNYIMASCDPWMFSMRNWVFNRGG